MSIIANNLLQGDEGYNISRSLRFRSSASAYLSRTPASAGNRKTWTYSTWLKRGKLGADQLFFSCSAGSNSNKNEMRFNGDDTFGLETVVSGSSSALTTTQVFRDPSAFYHIIVSCDTTQATASNRLKFYINGSQVTAFSSSSYPSLNQDLYYNSTNNHLLGAGNQYAGQVYSDLYLTEVNFIDGQALTPSSFGETDSITGVWKPKRYSGTYGTNGFYLPFTDNSALTSGSNAGLGKDFSGNGNYWNTNNISITAGSTYDSMTDVPTLTSASAGNYCVVNPINKSGGTTVADGNLTVSGFNTATQSNAVGTIAPISGKWYFETTVSSAFVVLGISKATNNIATAPSVSVGAGNAYTYYGNNGQKYNGSTGASYGATFGANDVIGVAFDLDNGSITFYKNSTSQGTAFTWTPDGSAFYPIIANDQSTLAATINANFGQRPFSYTPPTGFLALNTFNLPDSTIKAGNKHFDALLYSGNSGSQSITGLNFQPDFVWLKSRSTGATNHLLEDVIRGTKNSLLSNDTSSELARGINAFLSNGFSFNDFAGGDGNVSGQTYVAWNWKANGSAVSNTAGSITSQVSANTSAGFSVVTYTGSGVDGATIGHGLGVAPKMIITKRRNTTGDWYTYHASLGTGYVLVLQGTNAQITTSNSYKTVSSSTYAVGLNGDMNTNGGTYVAYCFSEVAGYSKFGSYTGNSSADGSFVYLGFRPKYLMLKRTDTAGYDWFVLDSARNTYNAVNNYLYPDLSNAEGSAFTVCDFLSNGFKFRDNRADWNGSGATYIYAAFAENPFKYSLAR